MPGRTTDGQVPIYVIGVFPRAEAADSPCYCGAAAMNFAVALCRGAIALLPVCGAHSSVAAGLETLSAAAQQQGRRRESQARGHGGHQRP